MPALIGTDPKADAAQASSSIIPYPPLSLQMGEWRAGAAGEGADGGKTRRRRRRGETRSKARGRGRVARIASEECSI